MPTLTDVAYHTRKGLKYFGFGMLGFIFLRIAITYGIKAYLILNPPPPPPPTRGFGLIPPLQFPDNPGYSYQFDLQTPNLSLPNFSDRAKVFHIEGKKATLMASEDAKQTAMRMKFFSEPKKIDEVTYEFKRGIPSPLTLKMNIITGAFDLNYQWQTDTGILFDKTLPGKDETISRAISFVSSIGAPSEDIDFINGTIRYYKAKGTRMVIALSLSEADFVKADFYRNPIDEFKVLTAKPEDGIISLIFSGSKNVDKQIVSAKYNYYKLNYLDPQTYALKPIGIAWEELKKGNGFIASYNGEAETIAIRRINLAYFDSESYQEFMQPIYVFYGDNNFVGYVRALANSEISKQQ